MFHTDELLRQIRTLVIDEGVRFVDRAEDHLVTLREIVSAQES